MAIRNRRGSASDFVPTKLVGAEFAVVQSGDENTSDGKALYLAVTDGQAKRIPFADELEDYEYRAQAAADDAIEAKNLAQAAQTASAANANAAAQAAQAASTAAANAQSTVDGAIDDIEAAKDAATEEIADMIDAGFTDPQGDGNIVITMGGS